MARSAVVVSVVSIPRSAVLLLLALVCIVPVASARHPFAGSKMYERAVARHDAPLPPPPPPPPPRRPRDRAQYSTRSDTGEFARRRLGDVEETESDRRKLQDPAREAWGLTEALVDAGAVQAHNPGMDWATLYDIEQQRAAGEKGMVDLKSLNSLNQDGLWDEAWCLRSGVPPKLCYYPQMPPEVKQMARKARERLTYDDGEWTKTGR